MACGGALLINSFTFIRYRIDHGQFHSTSLRHIYSLSSLPSQSYKQNSADGPRVRGVGVAAG